MTKSDPFKPITEVSQANCYKPISIYEGNGIHLWAFFEWSDKFSLSSVVFCQLEGDYQVGKVKFKDEKIYVSLEKNAKPLQKFKLSKKLEKNIEYPTIILMDDKEDEDDFTFPDDGTIIVRRRP